MRMPSGNSKDGNGPDQGFVFKPLGVKTVSRNNISPLANLVLFLTARSVRCIWLGDVLPSAFDVEGGCSLWLCSRV